jgi:hypothetical protein
MSLRTLRCFTALVVWLGVSAEPARAQSQSSANTLRLDRKENMAPAKIADLAWIQGRWVGQGLGGTAEEMWAPPLGNSMMGSFRLVKDGKVAFHELCTLVEEQGSVVLKLKHFDANLKGWEEKDKSVDFPLVRCSPNEAWFDGLTFRKTNDGDLHAYVLVDKKGDEVKEVKFVYHPAGGGAGK